MIKIKNLKKYYKQDEQTIRALDGINLEIIEGSFVVILGQSGCGKSTLLNIIGGLDRPTYGEVNISKQNIEKSKQDKQAKYRLQSVGMVFQKFNLINDMTVLDNVTLPLKFSGYSEKKQKEIATLYLKKVGLADRAKSIPTKLSGGQQQRVAIARALVNKPKILLCDEPTGNLDSKTGNEILKLLKQLNQIGITVVVVTHNQNYSKVADHTVEMLDGKIIKQTKNKKTLKSNMQYVAKKSKNISLLSLFKIAQRNISRRKLRVFLTSFGVAIGAMAVVVLVAFGAGLQRDVNQQIQSYSSVEEISVQNIKPDQGSDFSFGPSYEKAEEVIINDQTLKKFAEVWGVEAVYANLYFNAEAKLDDKNGRFWSGSSKPLKYVKEETRESIEYGGFFTSDDESSVIIPAGLATTLGFENKADIIGKEIEITNFSANEIDVNASTKSFKLKIVGVMKNKSGNYQCYIPYNHAIMINNELKQVEIKKQEPGLYQNVTVRAVSTKEVSKIKEDIEELGYFASSYEDMAKQINRIFSIMQTVLGVIGGIALLVASLGIINTMVMAILERTKEIGILKAIGARPKDILLIFITESSLIGFYGGVGGLIMGYAGTKLIEMMVNSYLISNNPDASTLTFFIPVYLSFGVVLFSILISSLAGFIPSKRAANLDPVAALRDE